MFLYQKNLRGAGRVMIFQTILAFVFATSVGCKQLTGSGDSDDNMTLLTGLLLLPQSVTLNYNTVIGSQNFACGTAYTVNGTGNVKFRDFRFFASDFRMILSDNSEVPVTLMNDNTWQSNGIALLDFETGSCGSTPAMGSGSTETNKTIRGTIPAGSSSLKGVKFTLGIPDSLNFLNVTDQPSPLNINAMYWSWTSGYRFAKIEFSTDNFTTNITNFHLGSTGCSGGTCANKYRPTVSVTKTSGTFSMGSEAVTLDLNSLLNGYAGYGSANSCMPGTAAPCTTILSSLGLDGTGVQSGLQSAFSIK